MSLLEREPSTTAARFDLMAPAAWPTQG